MLKFWKPKFVSVPKIAARFLGDPWDVGRAPIGAYAQQPAREAADLVAVGREKCGGGHDHAARGSPPAEVERPAHDADHAEPHDRARRVANVFASDPGFSLGKRKRPEVGAVTHVEVELRGEALADRELVGVAQVGFVPLDHTRAVNDAAEPVVDFRGRRGKLALGVEKVELVELSHRRDARAAAKLLDLGRRCCPSDVHFDVGGSAFVLETLE